MGTLKSWLEEADTVLVGAGSGLSVAAGMTYSGTRFTDNFADFISVYHYGDMYRASFQPYPTLSEYWAFWSRMIMINRYTAEDNGTYARLLDLLDGKDYFILTTNVDHCFQRFGFDKRRLFYTQGDYGLLQCSHPCCQETFDNEEVVRRMYEEQTDMRVPKELIPRCPHCGRPLIPNLRVDDGFVQDAGWYEAADRYRRFTERCTSDDTLFLELGVGYNTPGIIKYPFWRMTSENPRSRYACVSIGSCEIPPALGPRAVGLDMDIAEVLGGLSHC